MTYTEAAKINHATINRQGLFKDHKKIADGSLERWVKLECGLVGYVRGIQHDTGNVLVMCPVKSNRNTVELVHYELTPEQWKTTEKLSGR